MSGMKNETGIHAGYTSFGTVTVGLWVLDYGKRIVTYDNSKQVCLTPQEAAVLCTLMLSKDKTVPYSMFNNMLYSELKAIPQLRNLLKVFTFHLRKKMENLASDTKHIQPIRAIRGKGYLFQSFPI